MLELYPYLCDEECGSNDVERVVHSHGFTWQQVQKWAHSGTLQEYVEECFTENELDEQMDIYDDNKQKISPSILEPTDTIMTSGLWSQWEDCLLDLSHNKALNHFRRRGV